VSTVEAFLGNLLIIELRYIWKWMGNKCLS